MIDEIDYEDIKSLMGRMTYEKCKVLITANDIFKNEKADLLPTPIGKQRKEQYFKTNYQFFEKPDI